MNDEKDKEEKEDKQDKKDKTDKGDKWDKMINASIKGGIIECPPSQIWRYKGDLYTWERGINIVLRMKVGRNKR